MRCRKERDPAKEGSPSSLNPLKGTELGKHSNGVAGKSRATQAPRSHRVFDRYFPREVLNRRCVKTCQIENAFVRFPLKYFFSPSFSDHKTIFFSFRQLACRSLHSALHPRRKGENTLVFLRDNNGPTMPFSLNHHAQVIIDHLTRF